MNRQQAQLVLLKKTGAENPFNNIDVGTLASPRVFDFDEDGDLDLVVGENQGVLINVENYFGTWIPFD